MRFASPAAPVFAATVFAAPTFAALVLAAVTLVAALPVWSQTTTVETTPPADAAVSSFPAITVTLITMRKMQDHILASGLIGPVEQVYVPPLIEGQPIETLLADVGDMVTAGQVLATLSTATLTLQKSQLTASAAATKAAIAQAEALLADAKSTAADARKTADRSKTLFAQGTISTATNDQAQTAATSAASRVTVAEQSLMAANAQQDLLAAQMANVDLQLNRANVVAPVSGVVSARNATIGAIASAAGQPLFVIIRDNALELSADVAEADLARIKVGQPAALSLASTSTPLAGHVRLVEPTINTTTRLGRARISVDDSALVRSGMFAEADILVSARDTIAAPVTAVTASADGNAVMLVKDGVVSRVLVTTGVRDGAWVEILSGLAAGDTIVAKAGSFVSDGDKINPIPSESN